MHQQPLASPATQPSIAPERKRRLSDRIEQAFDQACDQGLTDIAACMLKGLDMALLGRPLPWDRRQAALSTLRTAQARLEELRSQDSGDVRSMAGASPSPLQAVQFRPLPIT